MRSKICSRCHTKGLAGAKTSYYCKACRKAVNAKRSRPEVKQARLDRYYNDVTIPRLQAMYNKKYPYKCKKPGVFVPVRLYGIDNEPWNGIAFSRSISQNEEDE